MNVASVVEDSEGRQTVAVGRYLLHRKIARGGMATIHIARLMGDEGFSRIVAAKRLLPELAEDTEFVAMFLDEARIASKVHHPNVVPVLDLVTTADEVLLVQEYVHGVPLHVLLRTVREAHQKIPVRIAVGIAAQVLSGLHAAHTTVDEMGEPLGIVHRDVSPQNIMIAVDGSARLLDFGVAKATMAAHVTRDGTFKGKLAYCAPEQVCGKPVPQSDVYSLSVVLWELLVGHRMHASSQSEAELLATIMNGTLPTIRDALANEADWGAIDGEQWKLLQLVEPIVARGLAADANARFESAADMEEELARVVPPASSSEIATWVKAVGKDFLDGRDRIIAAEEASWRRTHATISTQPGRRATTIAGDGQRASLRDISVLVPLPQTAHPEPVPAAPLPPLRNLKVLVAGLGALVVVLLVIVVAARSTGAPRAAPAAVVPAADASPPQVAPSAPVPAPPVPTAEVVPVPAAANPARTDEPKPPTRERAPVHRVSSRPERRPPVSRKQREEEPPPPPPAAKEPAAEPAPAAAEKPKDDCNPPYFFQGTKKVFKPQCL